MEKNYPDNSHVIRVEDDNPIDKKRANAIKYWCTACGNPCHNGKHGMDERELPKPLQRAYRDLWEEDAAGCRTYLVETEEVGYGIALIAEYDEYFGKTCGLTMDGLFETLLKDMEDLAAREELWCAHFYALECAGFDNCHELAIVLPANLPVGDWERVKEVVEQLTYKHANENGVVHGIKENLRKYHEACGHYDLVIGDPVFPSDEYVEVPVKYKWRLNAWDKEVDTHEILVRDTEGYWNLACGFGFERFQA